VSIVFTKMSGSGNDFIIIDNRELVIEASAKRNFVSKICIPKVSVGADGVIFVEKSKKFDFKWDFYNGDGSSAEMCGNGGRCVARYAYEKNIAPEKMSFETTAGIIKAEVKESNVRIKLTSPENLQKNLDIILNEKMFRVDCLNTGVPHAIIYTEDIMNEDVCGIGRGIRLHPMFSPAGTNVDFVQKQGENELRVRTYERGVEDETLACGTGVVASALLASQAGMVEPPIRVQTQGGEFLTVDFEVIDGSDRFGEVFLQGSAKFVFEGTLIEI
jgi:diaminopimelate epimerase